MGTGSLVGLPDLAADVAEAHAVHIASCSMKWQAIST